MNSLSLALRTIAETAPLITKQISTEASSRLQIITILALTIITACLTAYLYSTHQLIHRLKHDLGNLKDDVDNLKSPLDPYHDDLNKLKNDVDFLHDNVESLEHDLAFLNGNTFQIFVKTLTGKTLTLNVQNKEKISFLKKMIQSKEGIPPDMQKLSFAKQQIKDDNKTINDLGIQMGSTVHLMLRLSGD